MITFSKFLLGESNHSLEKMTGAEFVQWAEKNAQKFLTSGQKIFRGWKSPLEPISIIDANKIRRVSVNSFNFYTLWMDNHPAWDGFPKRSQSLICSASSRTARSYGNASMIIPSDDAMIGVCSKSDLWFSFPMVNQQLGLANMDTFNSVILEFIDAGFGSTAADKANKSWPELKKYLTLLDEPKIKSLLDHEDIRNPEKWHALMVRNGYATMYEMLEPLLNPQSNGFDLVSASNINVHGDLELWMSGTCGVINTDTIDSLGQAEAEGKEFFDFLSKYNLL